MKIGDGARTQFGASEGKVEVIVGDMVGIRHSELVFYHESLVKKVDYLIIEENRQGRDKDAIKRAEADAKKRK